MFAVASGVLGLLACASAAAAAGGLAWSLLRGPRLHAYVEGYSARIEADLRYTRAAMPASRLVRSQAFAVLACVVLALAFGAPAWLPAAAACAIAPPLWLARLRRERSARIAAQIDAGLLAVASALDASSSLGEALASASRVLSPPLSEELERVVQEAALGASIDDALGNFAARVERPRVTAALVTLQVARNTGGAVVRTLTTCAASLRELARLEGVVESKTAESRAQAVVVAIIPAPLLLVLDTIDPHLLEPVWRTTAGHVVVAIATLLWVSAVLLAREIADVDV